MSAYERGWGDPGDPNGTPAQRRREQEFRRENIVLLETYGVKLWVHKAVKPLFAAFIEELCRGGRYRLDGRRDDWGYANRNVRGSSTKSNHSWGLAVDLNAVSNPMTNDGRNHTDLPPGVSELARRYGLTWGGDYKGRKDPMHFEFTGTPGEASRRVARLTPRRSATPTTPTVNEEEDMKYEAIRRTSDGAIALVGPGTFVHVNPEEWKVHLECDLVVGGKAVDRNARQWDVVKKVAGSTCTCPVEPPK